MNYIKISHHDIANGEGVRVVLWVAGCAHHCKGCHNPQTWNEIAGKKFTSETYQELQIALEPDYIAGLTFSGGDPLFPESIPTITTIAQMIKQRFPQKNIWLWTGYLWNEIKHLELMNYIDVLVDGPYVEAERDITLKWRGSRDQRVIDVKKSRESGEIIEYK